MKRIAVLAAILAIYASGCASTTSTDDDSQSCSYNNVTFFCSLSEQCGPGICISDPDKQCGMLLTVCGENEKCVEGVCSCQTNGVWSACSGTCCESGCVDTKTDSHNCGACGIACTDGMACVNGICSTSCLAGYEKCNVNGIEQCIDVQHDSNHCGSCSNACPSANPALHFSSSYCSGGKCYPVCEAKYADSDSSILNGCESESKDVCGNGLIEASEVCDGTHLNDQTCETLLGEGSTGILRCSGDCHSYNLDGCSAPKLCGNAQIDTDEICDGAQLNGATCESKVGAGSKGTVKCSSNCQSLDLTACSAPNTCGNQVVDGNEKCDGSVPDDVTCATVVGKGSTGTLKCASNCYSYDVSGCTAASICGNGLIEKGEECDTAAFGTITCANVVGAGSIGSLLCTSTCEIDKSHCSAPTTCKDNIINGNDICDGTQLGGKTCADIVGKGSTGVLKCASNCAGFDVSGCSASASCNNGRIENGEVCDGQLLNDKTCADVVGKGSTGKLSCSSNCLEYIKTGCSTVTNCGNGSVDSGEVCDGANVGGKTCETEVGVGSKGTILCSSDCRSMDLSQCSAPILCGNGVLNKEAGEVCDSSNLNGQSCASIVGEGSKGTLKCGDGCMHFDISGCSASTYCGDSLIQGSEVCDMSSLAGRTCKDVVGYGSIGTLRCNATCSGFDTSGCSPKITCGDGEFDASIETCDGEFLNGWTCEKQVGTGSTGTPKCNAKCSGYENGSCTAAKTCGDGKLNSGEDCDKTAFKDGVSTCVAYDSAQFASGSLNCTSSCAIDTSGCKAISKPVCGNGKKEDGEACDGTDFGSATCQSALGNATATGKLQCSNDCMSIQTTACEYCGDNKLKMDATEECDGTAWGANNCVEYSSTLYSGGTLKCNQSTCTFDVSECTLKSSVHECDDGVRCSASSELQLCDNHIWETVESCGTSTPYAYCSESREECLPTSWCNIQSVSKINGQWVGYGRILPPSGISIDGGYMICTQDLSLELDSWPSEFIIAERNMGCSDCGSNYEYGTTDSYTPPSGTSYCTFVFYFGSDYYACLPIKNGVSEPMKITSHLRLTPETTYIINN